MVGSEDIFQGIASVAPATGLLWFSKTRLTKSSYTWGFIWLAVTFVIMMISFLMISSSLWKFYEGGSTNITLIITFSYITFLSLFYMINAEKVIQNHQNLLQLQETFGLTSAQDNSVFWGTTLAKHAKVLNMAVRLLFWFNFILTPINTIVKILYWNNIIEFHNMNDLVYKMYFDVSNSFMFWPTVILQSISLHVLVTFQPANEFYILSVMTLQLACFKHLRAELANILSLETCTTISTDEEFNETTNNEILNNSGSMIENNDIVNFKLQQWIQQHTYLLRFASGVPNLAQVE